MAKSPSWLESRASPGKGLEGTEQKSSTWKTKASRRLPTSACESAGALLRAARQSWALEGKIKPKNLGHEGKCRSLRKLEVSHNESSVWQRPGICFNIIALKKVKCLCQGLMFGEAGPFVRGAGCHGHSRKNSGRCGNNIPYSCREEGGIVFYFDFSKRPHY